MNRDRRTANYLLVLFTSVSLVTLSLPMAVAVQSFKACIAYLANPVPFLGSRAVERFSGLPAGIVQLLKTDIENRQLREDLSRLPWLETELRALRRENERLRQDLGMRPASGVALRWARVMERDALNWHRVLLVDAGKAEGVQAGAPVLGLERGKLGAVGRVTETGPRWAKVLLLTDELSSVAAYSPAKGWEGLVEGQGGPRMRMNYLPLEAQLVLGEPVYTSATSATFPPDVLIGTVTRVYERDPFLTFQSAELTPAVDSTKLKEVLILTPRKTDAEAPGELR